MPSMPFFTCAEYPKFSTYNQFIQMRFRRVNWRVHPSFIKLRKSQFELVVF